VNDLLLLCLDKGDAAVLALLDQYVAFDTIDHSILVNRPSCCFGITGSVLNWFQSYLYHRRQSVSISALFLYKCQCFLVVAAIRVK
jgi:hypothetical protein